MYIGRLEILLKTKTLVYKREYQSIVFNKI